MDERAAAKALTSDGDPLQKLINKIQTKWLTVRKAFKEFNDDNDGYISKSELVAFLNNFGFPLNSEESDRVFKYFDRDGDGQISY